MTSPPPLPSPLEGEGWVGGKILYCVCIKIDRKGIYLNHWHVGWNHADRRRKDQYQSKTS